ncbi:ABC transporter ATP-binding protein [Corynebacterium caspium]|uniref:ABC transporter ATP-binding protein n=1 Tax=Corynebacterium caspium TaxID=234828 RepID=UPI000379600F|nr:ABC transporter ATP-binding protein [Corynebacterium caspium]WKD58881.1 putative ABC transporter ATP-binding protein [Corynebacterium caspium DSM 44850]
MKSIIKIIRSTSALWPLYIGVALTSALSSVLAIATPFILREATDTIVATVYNDGSTPALTRNIIVFAAALFAIDLAHTLIHNVGGFIGDKMASRMRQILSTRYFAKLLALPQRYFDNQVTGTVIARLDRSIASITQFAQAFSNTMFPSLITLVASLAIMAYYDWPLAVLIALLFPIYLWLTTLTSKKWQLYEGKKNKHIDAAGGRFSEVISQVKVAKSFIAETRELNTFGQHYGKTVEITKKQSAFWHRMDTLRGAAMNLIFFGVYILLFSRTLHGVFSLGEMVMLLQLVHMARQPVFTMSWIVDSAQRAIAGSKDYFAVLAEKVEDTAHPELIAATESIAVPHIATSEVSTLQPKPGFPAIVFEDISFSYEANKPVLNHISFFANQGERIALVGESGGGKTTIVNLLLGLYTAQSGKLILCGTDTTEIENETLRASVGVVFQEPNLFSGTITENIAYGKPDATLAEIESAARRANAHDFIMKFPKGYDTVIGERGLRLSGGQKQRIAIARAMLKDAPILLLDEATSALDNRAEKAVQAGLAELMKDRTTIIIAHRLSTIADVDRIITLDEGRVDEIGTPAELAVSGGIYAQLLKLTASTSAEDRRRLAAFGFYDAQNEELDPETLPEPSDTAIASRD